MRLTDEQKARFTERVKSINPVDEKKVLSEYSQAERKARKRGAGHELLEGVKTLWQMLWEPTFEIAWGTKAWVLFALGYFIMPMDLIPDAIAIAIPPVGYVDDAIVVGWVISVISEEIETYRKWRRTHPRGESWIE